MKDRKENDPIPAEREGISALKAETMLLENVCPMDRSRYFEAVHAMAKSRKNTAILILGAALVPVCCLMGNRTLAVLALLAAVLAVFSRYITGWRDFCRLKTLHPGGTWTKTVRFYESHLTSDAGAGAVSETPYDKLRQMKKTERLCILDFGKHTPAVILAKDGFTTGSMEALEALIQDIQRMEADRRVRQEAPQS